jgi:AsmA protein
LVGTPTGDRAAAFELPFVVQGRWDDPIMLPDAQSLIRHSRATAPLLDALKGRTARDLVRSAIDQINRGTPSGPAAAVPSSPSSAVAPVGTRAPAAK